MTRNIISFVVAAALVGATALIASVTSQPVASAQSQTRRIAIQVDERGYHPGSVRVSPGETVTLVFTRTTNRGCGGTVVFPSRDIRRELPVDRAVEVTLTIGDEERLSFTCGMGMYRGQLVVER